MVSTVTAVVIKIYISCYLNSAWTQQKPISLLAVGWHHNKKHRNAWKSNSCFCPFNLLFLVCSHWIVFVPIFDCSRVSIRTGCLFLFNTDQNISGLYDAKIRLFVQSVASFPCAPRWKGCAQHRAQRHLLVELHYFRHLRVFSAYAVSIY